jgi:hypothetical protein
VARQNATFCPLGTDRIAMYAIADGPLTATLPAGWSADDVTGVALSVDKKEAVELRKDGRRITVQMQSRQPVMLYRKRLS